MMFSAIVARCLLTGLVLAAVAVRIEGYVTYESEEDVASIDKETLSMVFSRPFAMECGAMSSTKHRVFVYGTLKRDEPNYDLITNKSNGEALFLGDAHSTEKYPLVIASKYNIPFVLDKAGYGNHIQGEVYEIDDKMLSHFDELEDYPDFYWREKISVSFTETKQQTEAWIYLLKSFKPELLQLPLITDYRSTGPHGLKYLEKALRLPGYSARDDVLNVISSN